MSTLYPQIDIKNTVYGFNLTSSDTLSNFRHRLYWLQRLMLRHGIETAHSAVNGLLSRRRGYPCRQPLAKLMVHICVSQETVSYQAVILMIVFAVNQINVVIFFYNNHVICVIYILITFYYYPFAPFGNLGDNLCYFINFHHNGLTKI